MFIHGNRSVLLKQMLASLVWCSFDKSDHMLLIYFSGCNEWRGNYGFFMLPKPRPHEIATGLLVTVKCVLLKLSQARGEVQSSGGESNVQLRLTDRFLPLRRQRRERSVKLSSAHTAQFHSVF